MYRFILLSIFYHLTKGENNLIVLQNSTVRLYNREGNQSPLEYEIPCGIRHGYENNRIVGGAPASHGEFPWLISLQLHMGNMSKHICGGAIVSSNWILTAAHCVLNVPKKSIRIVAGDYKLYELDGTEQMRTVSRVISHSFELSIFSHDIALLKLTTPLKLNSKYVTPICVPNNYDEFTGVGTISGWGKPTELGVVTNILRYVNVPFIDPNKCENIYTRAGLTNFFNGCQLCAGLRKGGRDSCQGDSGGPLMCKNMKDGRYYICGIVSWGIGCARPQYPGVYTKVSCYSDWISRIIYNKYNILDGYPN